MRISGLPVLAASILSLSPFAAIVEDQTGSNLWFAPQVHQQREIVQFANRDKTEGPRTDHAEVKEKRGLLPLRTGKENKGEHTKVQKEVYRFAVTAGTVGLESAGMQLGRSFLSQAQEEGMEVMRPWFGQLAPQIRVPDWLKRVDVDIDLQENEGPVYSIRTQQPLFQSKQKINTLFTQFRWGKNYQFGNWRDVTNLGLGYRHLLMDKTLLVGANTFFDRDWRKDHNRLGWGVEARWFGVDFYFNGYYGMSASNPTLHPFNLSPELLSHRNVLPTKRVEGT